MNLVSCFFQCPKSHLMLNGSQDFLLPFSRICSVNSLCICYGSCLSVLPSCEDCSIFGFWQSSSEAQHKIIIIIKTIYSSETSFHPNITSTEAAVFSPEQIQGLRLLKQQLLSWDFICDSQHLVRTDNKQRNMHDLALYSKTTSPATLLFNCHSTHSSWACLKRKSPEHVVTQSS